MRYLLLLFAIFIVSCSTNNVHSLSITNQTEFNIDSIHLLSDVGQLKVKSLAIGKTVKDSFKVDKSGREGAFNLSIYMKDSLVERQFGYFGNSGDIPDQLNIVIEKDFHIKFNKGNN